MFRGIRTLLVLGGTLITFVVAVAWQASPSPERLGVLREAGPRWWKGNLHTHSLWSDGDDFPEMIADWYGRHGYHFLALSEHNVLADGQKWVAADGKAPQPEAER